MYLIGIKNNIHPLGNDGTLKTSYKANYKIKELANNFSRMNKLDEVYLINDYTQRLCELKNSQFIEYIRKNGKKLI